MAASSRTITVAAGQIEARLMNEAEKTLAAIERIVDAAGRRKADLLVLPECAYPAYLLGSVFSYRQGSHLTSGQFLDWLSARIARYRLHVVCGFVEDTGGVLYNSAALIDDRGCVVGIARKQFLWNADRDWYAPGDEIGVHDTTLGRIGITICAETRAPEILATLAHDGAELIAMPTCWINGSRETGHYENPQVSFLVEARAREFGVPFVCADKSGMEMPGVGYVGQSRIVSADGTLMAEAPSTGEALIDARLALQPAKEAVMDETERRRLLSEQEPCRPSGRSNGTLTVAAIPSGVVEQWSPGHEDAVLQDLAARGVRVVVAPGCSSQESFGMCIIRGAEGAGVTNVGPMRAAFVVGQAVRSFAAARVAALDGAEILVFLDQPDDLALLRSRALENRVFIIASGERKALIIDPNGEVVARADATDQAAIAGIDLAAARDKCVAPRTDLFDERRARLYRF